MKIPRLVLTLLFLALLAFQTVHAAAAGPVALVLTIDGVITPATQEYFSRGLQTAVQANVELVILQLNTPGGDLASMQKMAEDMRASTVPVVVYVTPRGAWAGSAGTVITLAGHAAAMAPETAIGAASPVGSNGQDLSTTEQAKVKQIMEATVRSYTERRGAAATDLAVATIESAKAVSATEALQAGLVDFIANDTGDLLDQLDGFTVQMADGPRTLHTGGVGQQPLGMSLIEQLLQFLVNSNVSLILMNLGMLALIVEISHPGGWVLGFFGVVCLALAGYGMGILSVNWFGLVFIVTAFVLFIIDIKAATHGGLTAAGIGAFIVGALVLFNSPGTPSFQRVSLPVVIVVSAVTGLLFAGIIVFALRAQRRPVTSGREGLIGASGVARTDLDPGGQVQAAGELWSAETVEGTGKIRRGEKVEVVKVEGLRLKVRKK